MEKNKKIEHTSEKNQRPNSDKTQQPLHIGMKMERKRTGN
jgi:hypothetical protein